MAVVGRGVSRAAKDWDYGVSKTRNSGTYPDGRRVGHTTGMITVGQPLARVEKVLHERFVSLTERETMADLRGAGISNPPDRRGAGRCTFDGQPRARPQRGSVSLWSRSSPTIPRCA